MTNIFDIRDSRKILVSLEILHILDRLKILDSIYIIDSLEIPNILEILDSFSDSRNPGHSRDYPNFGHSQNSRTARDS